MAGSDTGNVVQSSPGSESLKPGMVIGPDGKPCKICTAFRHWKPTKSNSESKQKDRTQDSNSNGSFAGVAAVMSTLASGPSSNQQDLARQLGPPEGCPPDVEQLGRATWTFLHTTAAYYPEKPTPSQRTRMLGLLMSLPVLYPCSWCASHLGSEMQRHPPDVSGRVGLSRWLCERHNEVNERLGKPVFDCSLKSTDERWKDGPSNGRCD